MTASEHSPGAAEIAPELPANGIPFAKMSGSGNDFVMIDNRAGLLPDTTLPHFARRVCRRGVGIGADGVVTIEPLDPDQPEADFRWRYLNADGSDGALCGNGAMCGARFAVAAGIAPARCTFQTPSGLVEADVDPDGPLVRISIADSGPLAATAMLDIPGSPLHFHAIRIGVPHAVAVVDDADAFADHATFAACGRAVRYHPHFQPDGTNANIIHRIAERTIRMRTYERGVEAETLACGTGAVASAIVATQELGMTGPVTVLTSSGRPLHVAFRWDAPTRCAREIQLTGEARFIARGTLDPEGWAD